jgi:hypothetical protein
LDGELVGDPLEMAALQAVHWTVRRGVDVVVAPQARQVVLSFCQRTRANPRLL